MDVPKPRPPRKSAEIVEELQQKQEERKKPFVLKDHLTQRPFHDARLEELKASLSK